MQCKPVQASNETSQDTYKSLTRQLVSHSEATRDASPTHAYNTRTQSQSVRTKQSPHFVCESTPRYDTPRTNAIDVEPAPLRMQRVSDTVLLTVWQPHDFEALWTTHIFGTACCLENCFFKACISHSNSATLGRHAAMLSELL